MEKDPTPFIDVYIFPHLKKIKILGLKKKIRNRKYIFTLITLFWSSFIALNTLSEVPAVVCKSCLKILM